MWTEPSPAQQLAEQIQKQIDESSPSEKANIMKEINSL